MNMPSAIIRRPIHKRSLAAFALILFISAGEACAVFLWAPYGNPRRLSLQIGTPTSGMVDLVTFNVQNAQVAPNNTPVAGIPNSNTSAIANGVKVRIETRVRSQEHNNGNSTPLQLTVNSSAGLSCLAGSGCGATIIPFNTIRWVAHETDAIYPGASIQNGTFNGGTQTLLNLSFRGASLITDQSFTFTYNNATLYPAGRYQGRVTYTATMP